MTEEERAVYHHAWYLAHREDQLAAAREFWAANREEQRALKKAHYAAHREEIKARQAEYRARKPRIRDKTKNALKSTLRRAREANVKRDLTYDQWVERVVEFNGCCAYCGRPMDVVTQDHMTPIVRGGDHTLSNVVPSCKTCNCKKHDWTLLEVVAGRRIFPKDYNRQ